jgi:diguanylate cyclase (GGDEF)-like protein
MSDDATAEEIEPVNPRPSARPRLRRVLLTGVVLLPAALGGTLLLCSHFLRHMPPEVATPWSALALLGATAVLAGAGTAYHLWRFWCLPARRLLRTVAQIRAGDCPLEELRAIGGGLSPLARQVRELLLDLRRQRAQIAQLEAEMHQRIANRTDALERTLGALRQQATRDALTGLHNRRLLDELLPRLIQRCAAEDQPLCVVMGDVDYFKTLNDELGHAAGDQMLRAIGQLIRSSLGEQDIAFRCGGDEFVLLLPGREPEAGQALGQRLQSLVDAAAQTLKVSPKPRLSLGVACSSEFPHPTSETLLRRADERLYIVKALHHQQAKPALRPAG